MLFGGREWLSLKLFLIRKHQIAVFLDIRNGFEQVFAIGRRAKKVGSLVTLVNNDPDLFMLEQRL